MSLTSPPARLSLKMTSTSTDPEGQVARALEAIPGVRSRDGWIVLAGDCMDDLLRCLNRACLVERATVMVFADFALPASLDGPYVRLWDRTDEFAVQLARWREGEISFPPLKPGDLVRLPI